MRPHRAPAARRSLEHQEAQGGGKQAGSPPGMGVGPWLAAFPRVTGLDPGCGRHELAFPENLPEQWPGGQRGFLLNCLFGKPWAQDGFLEGFHLGLDV